MEYLIGVILSLAVAVFAAVVGFDRERAFYPTVLIVIASYYILFAVIGVSRRTLTLEKCCCRRFPAVCRLRLQKKLLVSSRCSYWAWHL
jgi:hypothetical protein